MSASTMSSSATSNKCLFAILVCVIAIISTDIKPVLGQRVDVAQRNVTALEGQKTNLLCKLDNAMLLYCRIQLPGMKTLILSPEWDSKSPGFTYFGEGLDKGQCGVTIDSVMQSHNGPVRCFLGSQGQELEAEIELTVAMAPNGPELQLEETRSGFYEIGKSVRASCTAHKGRPAPTIEWFLNDEPITDGLQDATIYATLNSDNTTLYTTTQNYSRYIKATDDNKSLICRTSNIAIVGHPQESKQQLRVRFPPQKLPTINIYGVILSTTSIINATINANPRPRTEWIVDGVSIPQGTQNGRYESYEPVDLGNGVFNVSLSIAGLTLEDTTKVFTLKASNQLGQQDYEVRISSSEEAAPTGLDVGSIVGIVVAVTIVLVVVVLVVFARATGKWCFAAKSSSSKPHATETSDTESGADVKTSKPKIFAGLNFDKLFKKKKLVDEEADENAAGSDEQNAPSEATVIMEDDPPKPDEKNIVYAELMLKPSEDSGNPNKNATEYAEIVYVSKPDAEQKKPGK